MSNTGIKLESNEDGDMAYLFLPGHPGKGVPRGTAKQISLNSIVSSYKGPEVYLDFDKNGLMIGIEILLE